MASGVRKPLLAALGCVVAFCVVMAAVYLDGPLERLDSRTLGNLAILGDQGKDNDGVLVPDIIVHLADAVPLMGMLAGVCLAGFLFGRPRHALAAVAVVAGANVTSQILKVLLAHPRLQPGLLADIEPAALPSGHATAAMSIAVAAILVAPRNLRVPAVVAGAGFALAEGVSLVVLAWHYPSDVLAGFLVATCFGFLAVAALRGAEARWPEGPREAVARSAPVRSASAIGIAAAAGLLIAVASARADDLMAYTRDHTLGMAAALAIAMAAASLAAWLALTTDE